MLVFAGTTEIRGPVHSQRCQGRKSSKPFLRRRLQETVRERSSSTGGERGSVGGEMAVEEEEEEPREERKVRITITPDSPSKMPWHQLSTTVVSRRMRSLHATLPSVNPVDASAAKTSSRVRSVETSHVTRSHTSIHSTLASVDASSIVTDSTAWVLIHSFSAAKAVMGTNGAEVVAVRETELW